MAKKDIDVGIVWGPIAGYFAKRSPVPLTLQPLAERDSLTDFPFRFSIGMGVRRRDRALRDSLQTVLDRKEAGDPGDSQRVRRFPRSRFPRAADSPAGLRDEAANR